jgi:hypothetical protein
VSKKTKNKKTKKEKKVQNSSKKNKKSSFQSCFSKKIVIVPERKIASFQSCFSKKIVPVPARKILPFSLVSHLIDLFMRLGCCSFLTFNLVSLLILVLDL